MPRSALTLAACTLLLAFGSAHAQTTDAAAPATPAASESTDANVPPATARKQAAEIARGDPARWTREDTDLASQMKTKRKEIAAALQESQGVCRSKPKAERSACMKEARAIYQQEMAGLGAAVRAGR
jgi:hypothetical protein